MKNDEIYDAGILIVDDEEHIRYLWGEVLKEAGFKKIFEASNGLECINIIQENKEEVILILMDIKLGPNFGELEWHQFGLDIVKHLMNIYEGIIGVIFITAYDSFKDRAKILGNEKVINLDYIIKDFDTSSLVKSVEKNIPLILEKRKRLGNSINGIIVPKIESMSSVISLKIDKMNDNVTNKLGNILNEMDKLKNDIDKISKFKNSIIIDIGKEVVVIIIIAIFIICALYFGIEDFINKIMSKI
jgi:two-component system, response regulator, stage 0 sporulation protein F